MPLQVITPEEFNPVLQRLERLEQQQAIADIVLNHIGFIEAGQVMEMKIAGISTWKGLNSAADRGELIIDKTKKKALVSVKSLMELLRKKGYSANTFPKT